MKPIQLFLIALLTPFLLSAQSTWEFNLLLGGANYQGDLVETTMPTLKETNFAAGINARYYVNPLWSVRAGAFYGKLTGSDANFRENEFRNARSVSFESTLIEVSMAAEWEPFGEERYLSNSGNSRIISPYLFAGVGVTFTDPTVDISEFNGSDAMLELVNTDIQKSNSIVHLSIPVGFGLKADLSDNIFVGLELGVRYPFSDYLDGISLAGNPDRNDLYMIGGFNLGYKLKR